MIVVGKKSGGMVKAITIVFTYTQLNKRGWIFFYDKMKTTAQYLLQPCYCYAKYGQCLCRSVNRILLFSYFTANPFSIFRYYDVILSETSEQTTFLRSTLTKHLQLDIYILFFFTYICRITNCIRIGHIPILLQCNLLLFDCTITSPRF